MTKTVKIVCDECGKRCGGQEHFWYFINIGTFQEQFTEYCPPIDCAGDFCCVECAIAYLEKKKDE